MDFDPGNVSPDEARAIALFDELVHLSRIARASNHAGSAAGPIPRSLMRLTSHAAGPGKVAKVYEPDAA